MKFFNPLRDIADIVFPNLCLACEQPLNTGEKNLCLSCQLTLPKTNYHTYPDNPVAKHFWGRVPVVAATAYYHFSKQSRVQHLIYHLKYGGRQDVGHTLGSLLGHELKKTEPYSSIDLVTSVPLHAQKLAKRGFNQADLIGQGIAAILQKPFNNSILVRGKPTETQTKKGRIDRWKNVDNIFFIPEAGTVAEKHVLLVDDVVTTGSTLESCAAEILKVPGARVSIAALAHATY